MRIERYFPKYNKAHYGRPWGAILTFGARGEPIHEFNSYYDGSQSGGICLVEAEPGQIIVFGQKKLTGNQKSVMEYFVVQPDGSLRPIPDRYEARKIYEAHSL